jgi:eukaryotic-like serine/threonine-protein kinase
MPSYSPPPLASAPAGPESASPAPSPGLAPTPGSTTTAMLPPAQQPIAPVHDRAQQVQNFIAQYEGGECFFIKPVAVTGYAAQIEGYGSVVAPFQQLDDAFKRSNGFEADIGVRQVTEAQCPAVTFLNRHRHESPRAPNLAINDTSIRSGDVLRGSVSNQPGRHVDLLLVTDEGAVHTVTALLKPSGSGRAFSMGLQRTGSAGSKPQLLLAMASSNPLAAVQDLRGVPALQIFPRIAAEIAQSGQAVAVAAGYFKLE